MTHTQEGSIHMETKYDTHPDEIERNPSHASLKEFQIIATAPTFLLFLAGYIHATRGVKRTV